MNLLGREDPADTTRKWCAFSFQPDPLYFFMICIFVPFSCIAAFFRPIVGKPRFWICRNLDFFLELQINLRYRAENIFQLLWKVTKLFLKMTKVWNIYGSISNKCDTYFTFLREILCYKFKYFAETMSSFRNVEKTAGKSEIRKSS